MSRDAQIACEEMSKWYLRGTLAGALVHPRAWHGRHPRYWFPALEHVTLSVAPGQRLGIVGTNGSGKTTLLRLIAGVTRPTTGRMAVRGRVAPVLEPVAGLEPELTGRENIHLIGTILGMRQREITQKFDKIVAFAGVADFLTMPLKHYSLGMTMRLGFSIAIHVDAEIILVDEAWGIGDVGFQSRSIEQIRQLQARGVTSVLVSHDAAIIRQLTDQVLWLKGGRVVRFGPTAEVADAYLADTARSAAAVPSTAASTE